MSLEATPATESVGRGPSAIAALWMVLGYLVATAIPAVAGGWPRGASAPLAHIAGAAIVAWCIWRRSREPDPGLGSGSFDRAPSAVEVFADWLPLIAVALLYSELPLLIRGTGGTFHDATVQGWERAVFRQSPAQTLGRTLPPALSGVLHFGYLSYYALVVVPPLILYLRGRKQAFAWTVSGLVAAFVVCFAAFVAFPVQGPRYLWPTPPGVPNGLVRSLVLRILAAGSSRGAAFPSSHAAVAVTQSLLSLRWQPLVGTIVGVLTVFLCVGAVYGGFHYGVDVLAGAGLGAVVAGGTIVLARIRGSEQ